MTSSAIFVVRSFATSLSILNRPTVGLEPKGRQKRIYVISLMIVMHDKVAFNAARSRLQAEVMSDFELKFFFVFLCLNLT